MKVALPSGHTAEFRDVMMRGDIRACKRGITIVTSPDGSRSIEGSFLDDLTGRVVTRMMTAWDFGDPLPSAGATEDRQQAILDAVLSDKDWKAISAAVGPWVEECAGIEKPDVFTHVSGVKVQAASAADAALMDESPDFEREGDADPKTGSAPSAITSSASAALNGPTEPSSMQPTST